METKKCSKCGEHLPVENFNKSVKNKDGLQTYCKKCQVLIAKEYAEKRRMEKNNAMKEMNLLKVYSDPELAKFKPRELIAELKSRGYSGELFFTQRITV